MLNVDTTRLVRLALAGAVAGFIVFLIFNPQYARMEQKLLDMAHRPYYAMDERQAEDMDRRLNEDMADLKSEQGSPYVRMALFNGAFAALLGGLLLGLDELGSPMKRAAIRMLTAAGSGAALGGVSGLIAQGIFQSLLPNDFFAALNPGQVIFARTIGWSVMGIGAGVGVGIALGSARRVVVCLIGGLIGGFVGGLLFDTLAKGMMGGGTSRLIGFTLMGAAIGAAIAFVEEIAKQSWVTILSGAREGRSYILSKAATTVGRDELADIPLFGDMNIAKQHAVLRMEGSKVAVQALGSGPLGVNGAPTHYTQLRDRDVIQVGTTSMRFHQKVTSGPVVPSLFTPTGPPPVYPNPYSQPSPYGQPQPTQVQPQPTIAQFPGASVRLNMTVVSGTLSGQVFSFAPGTLRIGREQGYEILLAQDPMVSRSHAEISHTAQGWAVRDLGSTNGTYVNGVRVTQQLLKPGDMVGVGQTVMRVDAA